MLRAAWGGPCDLALLFDPGANLQQRLADGELFERRGRRRFRLIPVRPELVEGLLPGLWFDRLTTNG